MNYTPLYSALAPLATVTVSPTETPNLPAAPTATPTPTTTPISMPTPMPTPTSVVVDAPLAFYRFYFPLVGKASKLAQPADAVTADAVTPAAVNEAVRAAANEPPTPQPSQNVAAYQIWAFTAQQGASQVLTFTQALQMQVAARPWIARG